jgi:cell division protein FtsI/penicillin-binding protein 2
MRVPFLRPAAVLGAGVLAATSVLTACTSTPEPPKPEPVAAALAAGLASGDLTAVAFDGATPAAATDSVRNAIGGLASINRTVTVDAVTPQADNATTAIATLRWVWNLSGAEGAWTYSTDAKLTRATDQSWHVTWSPTLVEPKLTATERLTLERRQAPRGSILGANGEVLVGLKDVYRVGIDKGRVSAEQAQSSAAALATLLGIDGTAYAKTVAASGPAQFVLAITLRIEDPRIAGKTASVQAIPGAAAMPGQAMLAPTPTFARALLGTVGPATAELVSKSAGRIAASDTVGLSGLQLRYDAALSGQPGVVVLAKGTDSGGTATSRTLFTRAPVPGVSLRTTLERSAQDAAESVLGGVPGVASLVAVRPSTGEIVAIANSAATNGQAVATTGQAAPGSTFKIVSSLALLRAGLTPESPMSCTETVTVDGRVFKNYDAYPAAKLGQIPLRLALANSCNTAFIAQRATVSQGDLADAAAALGIGVPYDTGYSGFVGSVPREATQTEHGASMIGQGKVTASALSMAIVMATIVHGSTLLPRLVDRPAAASSVVGGDTSSTGPTVSATAAGTDEAGAPSGTGGTGGTSGTASVTTTSTPAPTTPPVPAKPLTHEEAQALQSMLRGVVAEGSAKALAGIAEGAKTGTAEFDAAGVTKTHAWMIAFRGDLAVAVYVEEGDSGAKTAGPLVGAFLQGYAG